MLIDFLSKNHLNLGIIYYLILYFNPLIFLILILNLILHWKILKNECILSFYEKKKEDKKYFLGKYYKNNELNISDLTLGLFLLSLYIISMYLIYIYTKNKLSLFLMTIIVLTCLKNNFTDKLHKSYFLNIILLFIIYIFLLLIKFSNKTIYITLFFMLLFEIIILECYFKLNDNELIERLKYYLIIIIILIFYHYYLYK